MSNEADERLELKIAFLERAGQELSDVVFRQQREIDLLRGQLTSLLTRFEGLKSEQSAYSLQEERPPHY